MGYKPDNDGADAESTQQVRDNGEGRVGKPARQHCLHPAEAPGMAAHALCWDCHPGLFNHRPGLHWHRRCPVCHFTGHPSSGGMAANEKRSVFLLYTEFSLPDVSP